jgi:hypothetical protein
MGSWYVKGYITLDLKTFPISITNFVWERYLGIRPVTEADIQNHKIYIQSFSSTGTNFTINVLVVENGLKTNIILTGDNYFSLKPKRLFNYVLTINDKEGKPLTAKIPLLEVNKVDIFIKLSNDSHIILIPYFTADYITLSLSSFNIEVKFTPKQGVSTTSVKSLMLTNTTPKLYIIWDTDDLGSNLNEIICMVEGDYLPCEQYSKKLIGKYSWFGICSNEISYFSKYPNLFVVMKGTNSCSRNTTYYQKAAQLNNTKLPTTDFYLNLLSFMSLRYFLSGLVSGELTEEWLLGRNTDKFYYLLSSSEFAIYMKLFQVTYKGYDKYMKY